jgi:hypothetical protein
MNKEHFCRTCYFQTGGWIPAFPMTQQLQLGDFCQIAQSRLRPLGNILNMRLVEEVLLSEAILLDEEEWKLNSGVKQQFCATEKLSGEDGSCKEWTRQLLEFEQKGSFAFYGFQPFCRMILNWHRLKHDVVLKLTQSEYAFREVYVITGVVTVENWGLALANQAQAQLEVSAQTRSHEWYELIAHVTRRLEQSRGIVNFSHDRPAYFFKAKKLVLSDKKRDHFLRTILRRQEQYSTVAMSNWLRDDMLNLLSANEMNLANGLEFFDWVDASLDDVVKLC